MPSIVVQAVTEFKDRCHSELVKGSVPAQCGAEGAGGVARRGRGPLANSP